MEWGGPDDGNISKIKALDPALTWAEVLYRYSRTYRMTGATLCLTGGGGRCSATSPRPGRDSHLPRLRQAVQGLPAQPPICVWYVSRQGPSEAKARRA